MKKNSGFTLIELMIIVAVVGLLATLAIPYYRSYIAKSQQTEARSNLAAIYVGMLAYTAPRDNDGFQGATLDNIGFETDGLERYSYSLVNVTSDDFLARATGIAGEVNGDVWQIDVTKVIEDVDKESFNR